MHNFINAASFLKPSFAVAIFPFDLNCDPGEAIQWTQQLVIDSATIGDVLIGKWNVWIAGPLILRFPVNVASTPPVTLFDIYEEMSWYHLSPFAMSSTIRNSRSPVGKIVTTHSRDGPRRYSIYSQVQLRGLSYQLPHMLVSWPIVDGTGSEPSPAQKITALGGHSFWLNKTEQDDFYTLGALSNSSPAKVWMWIINSLADGAFSNAFDSWPVFAHVNTNIRRCENAFFRNGSFRYDDLPTLLQSFIPIPCLPVLAPCPLTHSQSEETLARLMAIRSATTRSSWESELVYLREFTSSDTAPTPVGFVVT